ncbi:MAG: hypothetical protein N2513_07200 [Deltaproteobacteria bacterium]|nr:hypothetical protein [Deltaproteobacteria bacterium]
MTYLEDEELSGILETEPLIVSTKKSLADVVTFKGRLAEIRRQEFLIDESEPIDEVTEISVFVRLSKLKLLR